ncbi:MAG: CHAT domain-containing protein [Xenococcaceae cyanobacterium MO_234.B1]|nr:CHAT domain-containing protein [Xenococcaceae cyanobacterium MO_234.B1]
MKYWSKLFLIALFGLLLTIAISLPGNSQLNSSNLVQQAQSAYNQGLYQESLSLLKEAEQTFINQNQTLQQAQIQSLISLVQQKLGNWDKAQEAIDYGLALIANSNNSSSKQQILAQIWNAQGQLYFNRDKIEQALSAWETASQWYKQSGDSIGEKGANINRAQALENLGFFRYACNTSLKTLDSSFSSCENLEAQDITTLLERINPQSASWQLKGLSTIGNTLLLMGRLASAQIILENSLTLSKQLPQRSLVLESKILLSLAKVHQAKAIQAKEQEELDRFEQESQQAFSIYQQVSQTDLTNSLLSPERLEAKLNQLNLLIATEQWSLAQEVAREIDFNEASNRRSIAAKLNFARSLTALKQAGIAVNYSWEDIAQIYTQIIVEAESIDAKRIVASGYGYLGQLAFEQNLPLEAQPQQLLEKALNLAQSNNAPEIAYRWQWQLGRIYREQGEINQAIITYQAAFANLQALRSDLIALNREIQFSFREQVEPVYRELADLLLQASTTTEQNIQTKQNTQTNLAQARDVIESLKLAELDNYFQDACLVFEQKDIAQIDPYAATIYTIVLPQSLEVILTLPGEKLYHHSQPLNPNQLEQTIKRLRLNLLDPSELLTTQSLSLQVYNWLIKPFEPQLNLAKQQIKTLVFVLDGVLQNIPMSVLYDSNQYLIEKYAIAVTPGLQLLTPQSSSRKFSALIGGVSEQLEISNQNFVALKNVPREIEKINSSINSETLLNAQFNRSNLSQKLDTQPFSVVHLATHGQFSSNPNKTFILLWDQLLTLKDLSKLLQNRTVNRDKLIDLLVLSACETAVGDDRAALGLAGMAVRTGASSTLATLWQVGDESTATLMANFYQQLSQNPQMSRAEALRMAQIELWKNPQRDWKVPIFWAPYILVGNWK